MLIKELRLKNFGRFMDKVITFSNGMNLIYGENEAGKTTIHRFIQAMLFGLEKPRGKSSKEDDYTRYEPIVNSLYYEGSMDVVIDDTEYRLYRKFSKAQKVFTITELETGRIVPIRDEELIDFYEGLTEVKYKNTLSIGQLKAKTEKGLREELRNYITNLSLSKTSEVDVTSALEQLTKKKKALEKLKISDEIVQIQNDIKLGYEIEEKREKLSSELVSLSDKTEHMDGVFNSNIEDSNRLEQLEEDMNRLTQGIVKLEERYERYKEYSSTYQHMLEKKKVIESELEWLEYEYRNPKQVQAAITSLESLEQEILVKEEWIRELEKNNRTTKEVRRYRSFPILFILILTSMVCIGVGKVISSPVLVLSSSILLSIIIMVSIAILYLRRLQQVKSKDKYGIQQDEISKYGEELESCRRHYQQVIREQKVASIGQLYDIIDTCKLWDKNYGDKEAERRLIELSLEQEWNNITLQQNAISRQLQEQSIEIPNGDLSDLDKVVNKSILLLEAKRRSCNEQRAEFLKSRERDTLRQEKIRWELEQYDGNEESIYEKESLLRELELRNRENENEIQAITLAIETISSISIDIHDSFSSKLNQLVGDAMSSITMGRYDVIKVDEELEMKVGLEDRYFPLERFSAGTIEQLFLALRLGIGEIMFHKKKMPLLLDDSFCLYDDNRVKFAIEELYKRDSQVILFTCHNRERHILDESDKMYHYIEL